MEKQDKTKLKGQEKIQYLLLKKTIRLEGLVAQNMPPVFPYLPRSAKAFWRRRQFWRELQLT